MGVLNHILHPGGRGSHSAANSMGGADVHVDRSDDFSAPALKKEHRKSRFQRPKTVVIKPKMPEEDKHTPSEMIPVLTLLTAHAARVYNEGYFMLLPDLNNDGRPVPDRHWIEVFGTLAGNIITAWDAASLDSGDHDVAAYLNITDATFKSIPSLPSPQGELENIVVLSTTMKNRYLLQFSTRKMFDEWTAAMRLSVFEHQALEEAYTGALLSAKGPQLHGIRSLLAETKYEREEKCSVRFGAGMPWLTVRAVIIPCHVLKHKKERKAGFGRVEFWDTPAAKPVRKGRLLATVHRASACYAVFPERAVLMETSSLINIEGEVSFEDEQNEARRESSVFVMPDSRPGISGFEMLIRTIIPLMDVFQLYGRPKRLNPDKSDINSLLFAMPTLPKAYYCDVMDIYMLTNLEGSASWGHAQWCANIKELLARKMATGYRGTGNIHEIAQISTPSLSSSRDSSMFPSTSRPASMLSTFNSNSSSKPFTRERERAVSEPQGLPVQLPSTDSQDSNLNLAQVRTPTNQPTTTSGAMPTPSSTNFTPSPGRSARDSALSSQRQAPRAPVNAYATSSATKLPPPSAGATATKTSSHERSLSEGVDRNQLVTASGAPGLITPDMSQQQFGSQLNLPFKNHDNLSRESFKSAKSTGSGPASSPPRTRSKAAEPNLFDPTFRPSHMSYAEYNEYVKSYLKDHPGQPIPENPPQTQSASKSDSVPNLLMPVANGGVGAVPKSSALQAPAPVVSAYPNAPGSPGRAYQHSNSSQNSGRGVGLASQHPSGPRPAPGSGSGSGSGSGAASPFGPSSETLRPPKRDTHELRESLVQPQFSPAQRVVSNNSVNSIKSVGSIPGNSYDETAPPELRTVSRPTAQQNPPSPQVHHAQGAGWGTTIAQPRGPRSQGAPPPQQTPYGQAPSQAYSQAPSQMGYGQAPQPTAYGGGSPQLQQRPYGNAAYQSNQYASSGPQYASGANPYQAAYQPPQQPQQPQQPYSPNLGYQPPQNAYPQQQRPRRKAPPTAGQAPSSALQAPPKLKGSANRSGTGPYPSFP